MRHCKAASLRVTIRQHTKVTAELCQANDPNEIIEIVFRETRQVLEYYIYNPPTYMTCFPGNETNLFVSTICNVCRLINFGFLIYQVKK